MAKKKHLLLIDAENILHQSFHKFANLKSKDGKPSGAIFGFFRSLHYYVTRFNPDDVICTFDNGHSKHRVSLLENYKGHRQNLSINYESLQAQKAIIQKMLGYLGIRYIFDKKKQFDYEGDDYLALMVLDNPLNKITIVSSDKDFNQLINNNVRILNPRKDELVTIRNCKEVFGYEPHETVSYLALVGDSSDDIPGYPGIGPKKARAFLDKYGTIENALKMGCPLDKLTEVWGRNQQLIDLTYFLEKYPMDRPFIPFHPNRKRLRLEKFSNMAESYSMKSFLTPLFQQPFKDLFNGKD